MSRVSPLKLKKYTKIKKKGESAKADSLWGEIILMV